MAGGSVLIKSTSNKNEVVSHHSAGRVMTQSASASRSCKSLASLESYKRGCAAKKLFASAQSAFKIHEQQLVTC